MVPSEFSPFPPPDLAPAEKLAALRQALEQNLLEEAEREWLILIRGLRGHSEHERQLLSQAYECYAAVLAKEGKEAEAERMVSRARVVRDGASGQPKKIERREMTYSFMKEIRADEGGDGDHEAKVAMAKARVEAQIKAGERREKTLKIAGCAIAGLVGGPILGVNALLSGALGLGLGGAVFARR
jgi:hypothetical protein